jgi:putative salt-induced outer membrane protein YdiY
MRVPIPLNPLNRFTFRAAMLVLALSLAATTSLAVEGWEPPEASKEQWDWVMLDTEEWLKGEMLVMRRDNLYFDSDKFHELTIDWDDVHELRLSRPRVFRRKGRRTYAGIGRIKDGFVQIVTSNGQHVDFPRDELVGIVYTEESEIRNWHFDVGISLAARSGNTDQQDLSSSATISRDTPFHRWLTTYVGTFSEVEGDRTVNNHRATTSLDFLVTKRFFVRVPSFEFFMDEFQNIDARYTPGVGVGYEFIDTSIVSYISTIGGAAQITQYDGGIQDEDAALLYTSELSFEFPRDIDLDLAYKLQLIVTDLDKTSHNTSAVLSFEIWDPLDLDVGAYWDRIEGPQRVGNDDRPERDDFRLTVGLSIDF